jgi:hypothetical protein
MSPSRVMRTSTPESRRADIGVRARGHPGAGASNGREAVSTKGSIEMPVEEWRRARTGMSARPHGKRAGEAKE